MILLILNTKKLQFQRKQLELKDKMDSNKTKQKKILMIREKVFQSGWAQILKTVLKLVIKAEL